MKRLLAFIIFPYHYFLLMKATGGQMDGAGLDEEYCKNSSEEDMYF